MNAASALASSPDTQSGLLRAMLYALVGASVFAAMTAHAEPSQVERELDAELKKLVDTPAPRVELLFEGLHQKGYRLVDAQFTLDGMPIATPSAKELDSPGSHPLLTKETSHGRHTLESQVTYTDENSPLAYRNGYQWKVNSEVNFMTLRGLETRVRTSPVLVEGAEMKKKFGFANQVTARMIARLDDGSMPEAPAKWAAVETDAKSDVQVAATEPISAGVSEGESKQAPVAEVSAPAMDEAKAVKVLAAAKKRSTPKAGVVLASAEVAPAPAPVVAEVAPVVEIPAVPAPVVAVSAPSSNSESHSGMVPLAVAVTLALAGMIGASALVSRRMKA